MRKLYFLLTLTILSCSNNESHDLNKLEGYWEIYQVEKEGKIVKEFTISTNIDYFRVKEDSTGFRKKVAPQLDGSFIVSKDISNFKVSSNDNSLHLIYTNKGFNADEIIKELSQNNLVILNSEGILYRYKRFEKLDLLNE